MKLLVITGGRHPYEESTPILESFLKSAGHDVTVTEDASALADEMNDDESTSPSLATRDTLVDW